MTRTAAKRRSNKRPNWALRILLIALFAFVAFQAVRLCAEIVDTRQAIAGYEASNSILEGLNESKQEQIDGSVDDTLEDKANEDGKYRPGQQIYQNSAG